MLKKLEGGGGGLSRVISYNKSQEAKFCSVFPIVLFQISEKVFFWVINAVRSHVVDIQYIPNSSMGVRHAMTPALLASNKIRKTPKLNKLRLRIYVIYTVQITLCPVFI